MDWNEPEESAPLLKDRLGAQFLGVATVILALATSGYAFKSYVEARYTVRLAAGLIAPGPALLPTGEESLQFNALLADLNTAVEARPIGAAACPAPAPEPLLLRSTIVETCAAPANLLPVARLQPPLRLQPGVAALTPAGSRGERIWLSPLYRPGDPRLVSVVAAGDTMMGSLYPSRAGLNPALIPGVDAARVVGADLAGIFRGADVAFLNLEGPLYDGLRDAAKDCANCFAFRSPEHYGRVLASLGLDVASLANNHSGDFGEAGRTATISALREAGIAAAGLTRGDARTATLILGDGRRVGVAAFAPNAGTLSLNDVAGAEAIVRTLSANHDLVVVSFHGGAEGWGAVRVPDGPEYYLGENRGAVENFAHRMIDAGASLVLGHGPHVPRAVEIYRGRLIAYSLGNFWTYGVVMNYAVSGLGPVLEAWLTPEGAVAGMQIHSTRQAGLGVPRLDPLNEAARYMMYLTRQDYPGTEALLTRQSELFISGKSEPVPTALASSDF